MNYKRKTINKRKRGKTNGDWSCPKSTQFEARRKRTRRVETKSEGN